MKIGLRSKLSLSYAVMALLLVALTSLCINFLFQAQFKNYVIQQQKQRNQEIVSLIQKQYGTDGSWDESTVENIGIGALEQGMIIRVLDASGATVWDATVHNNGMCAQMLSGMAQNMKNYYPNFQGGYEQAEYPLRAGGKTVGKVLVGYYGPYYYTENDIHFLSSVNTALLVLGLISLAGALLLGGIMAKRISRPVSGAVKAAEEISRGNFTQRISERPDTKEMARLTDSVNHLADSLEQQQALRKRMSADVAHELRTPLANLQSAMEAMIDGVWEPSAQRLESCHEEILRITRLVGDLEKLEKAEAEAVVLNRTEFDAAALTEKILNSFEPEFRKKGIQTQFSGGAQKLDGDRDKISQIVVNLLSNALKYTPEGGSVRVSVGGEEQAVYIAVSDMGVGISAEDLPYVFERFYRADQSRNRLTGGSGLGLAIALAIAKAHRGDITVRSSAGKGSTFTLRLPRK